MTVWKRALVARSAVTGLDAERSKLYFDVIFNSLSEAARCALKPMDTRTYIRTYGYQSDFARGYLAQGRADFLIELLASKFGTPSAETEARIRGASAAELGDMC